LLPGRVQYYKVNDILSKPRSINLSIVQGSGLDPSLYVIMECDLQHQSQQHILMKYADDTTLLVPAQIASGMMIENWALKNKIIINKAKTKELVFRRPYPTKFDMHDPLDGTAQKRAAKLLGVIFTGKLHEF